MTVHTILPAIGHPDHVPYIITFAFAGHGRRKKSLLLRINMYRSAVLPVNSSCDTITYFPLAQHAETLKLVLKKVQNSQNPFRYIPIDTPLKYTFNFTFTYLAKSIFSKNQLCVSSKIWSQKQNRKSRITRGIPDLWVFFAQQQKRGKFTWNKNVNVCFPNSNSPPL